MYLSRNGKQEPIQAMAMCLSAAVDGSTGKNIELVQHTPKRDKGPQTAIQITKLAPTPPGGKLPQLHDSHGYSHNLPSFSQGSSTFASPYLPLQAIQEASSSQHQGDQPPTSPTANQHTFERVQFKSATANNGKRRAQQQYYHLIIELYVDIRLSHERSPNWVKVAQRASSQVVVRGRSPSHYSNEGPHSTGSRGSGGASGGSGIGPMGGSGGAYGSAGFNRPLGPGFSYANFGGAYRGGTQYSLNIYPSGSKSESSASSISGGSVDTFPENSRSTILSSNVEEEDGAPVETNYNGYQYYPSPLYDATLPPPIKSEGQGYENGHVKEETHGLFGLGGLFTGGIGRYQGVDSSRGFYGADTVYWFNLALSLKAHRTLSPPCHRNRTFARLSSVQHYILNPAFMNIERRVHHNSILFVHSTLSTLSQR
jgi:meiosis-specific transcription factor NDT80